MKIHDDVFDANIPEKYVRYVKIDDKIIEGVLSSSIKAVPEEAKKRGKEILEQRELKKVEKISQWLEKTIEFGIESFSLADMITDIILLIQLYRFHLAWATITAFTIVCPYYIAYSPLLIFYEIQTLEAGK